MSTGTLKTAAILWLVGSTGNPQEVCYGQTWESGGVAVERIPTHQVRKALQQGLPVYGWMMANGVFPVYGLRAEHMGVHKIAWELELAEESLREATASLEIAQAQLDRCKAAVAGYCTRCDSAATALSKARQDAGLPPYPIHIRHDD